MKLIIDIPDYNLDDIQNGSIACGQILKAVKNGKPYEEKPQGDLISREALKKDFEKIYPLSVNEMGGVVNKQIYDIIDNVPTVENITVFLENADESTLFDIKKQLAQILTDRAEREAYEEARREAMKLDDNEDSLKWRFNH